MDARTKAAVGAVALAAALLLLPLPQSWQGSWQSTLLDLGHVPLFFALTIYLGYILDGAWLWAAAIAVSVAGLAELAQDLIGRSSSWLDFVRGGLGTAAGVVLIHACREPRTLLRLAGHALALIALLAWPLADATPQLLDAYEGHQAFPTLADFATDRQRLRWDCIQATLERFEDQQQISGRSGRLHLLPGPKSYPAAVLYPVVRDWSGQARLCCTFTVVEEPLHLVLSLRSRDPAGRSTHYQFEETYSVGLHSIEMDLVRAARRAEPRPLNLDDIYCLQFFIYRRDAPRTMILHRVWLQ